MPYSWVDEFGDQFDGRRVLVTGASGFIGTHLCEALSRLGALVFGLDLTELPVPYVHRMLMADLKDSDATRSALYEIKPDLIYHLAGLVTASQQADLVLPMLQNNLVSTVNLLCATLSYSRQRVVVVGSSEEIGSSYTEGIPTSPYAAAKSASMMYARMFFHLYKLPVVMARPFMAFGPRQQPAKFVPYVILSLLRNESPAVSSTHRIADLIYVTDLVRGFLKVGVQASVEGRAIDLGTGTGIRLGDVTDLLVKLTRSSARPRLEEGPGRTEEYPQIANIEQTRHAIDWCPIWSLQEGLAETVGW
ncbi:MAG: NAD(P)-dependent oxidoreductase, partial [Candidatus Marsarchaeota archaeon]|nr:NAD(P)-dependent oxidoreductase [Candidatus Marsarchaeota archaeon]